MSTYPIGAAEGVLTADEAFKILRSPSLISRRVAEFTDQKFIGDYLLSQRLKAVGGGVFYADGEPIFPDDESEVITPGGEYPLTVLSPGQINAVATLKRGIATHVFDETVAQQGIAVVNRAVAVLGNGVIRDVDGVAVGVVASQVTETVAASAAWTSVGAFVESLLTAQLEMEDREEGLSPDTVLLKGTQYAKVIGMLVQAGALPRESANTILASRLPVDLMGFTWVTNKRYTGTNPMLLDRANLGGMADEDIPSEEFVKARGGKVEVANERIPGRDGRHLRARRVSVPVVLNKRAGVLITGTGLGA